MVRKKKSKAGFKIKGLIWLLVIFFFVLSHYTYQYFFSSTNNHTKVHIPAQIQYLDDRDPLKQYSVDEINQAIDLSADYLNKRINPSGQFVYRTNLNGHVIVQDKYNILRHAGTIYALCNYYKHTGDQNSLDHALLACGFMLNTSIKPVSDTLNLYGIWSLPQINKAKDQTQLKLGGTGIGLLALLTYWDCNPEFLDQDLYMRMGDFLIYMQKEDGSFYSKYYPETGRDDRWTSLYYPGEAALGLVRLYEQTKDIKYLKSAAKAINYLFNYRLGKERVEADHWALLASERLLLYSDLYTDVVSREKIELHAAQICKSILNEYPYFPEDSPYYGSLTNNGRTTPTATRLEGLISAYNFLSENFVYLKRDMMNVIPGGINFLVRSQIQQEELKGGIPRAYFVSEELQLYNGIKPDSRDTEVRIDYNQHAMCAMMQYLEMIK
ncbi:MAG: hypothetical protein JEZ03_15775 [Bacteroidales bacterium]|nr:hypothetical protein [Bacteroidales bacterium]